MDKKVQESMIPELHKLRRFALVAGLVLLSYSIAGIGLEPGAKASLFGIPFVISRPELLPLGLILASLYGFLRFYYYGLMIQKSPYRHRHNLLSELREKGATARNIRFVYFGPSHFSTDAMYGSRATAYKRSDALIDAFPKFAGKRLKIEVKGVTVYTGTKETKTVYQLKIVIPPSIRIMTFFHDFDYSLPVWLNIVALIIVVIRLLK